MTYLKKREKDFKGGIDIISPSYISGWVFSKSVNFSEANLISKSRKSLLKKFLQFHQLKFQLRQCLH